MKFTCHHLSGWLRSEFLLSPLVLLSHLDSSFPQWSPLLPSHIWVHIISTIHLNKLMYHILILTILFITASPPALLFLKTGHRRLQKATANFAGDHTESPALHRHLGTSQPERSQQWATQTKSNVRSYLLSKWATSQHHYGSSLHHRYWQISKNIPIHS